MIRNVRLILHRLGRRAGLSQRFLLVSVIVVACAMLGLGSVVSHFVKQSIVEGVASTAVASVDSLVANSINGISIDGQLSSADRALLDTYFNIGDDAATTRLVQLRIYRLDGTILYEASNDIVDAPLSQEFEGAKAGLVSSDLVELLLRPVGPFGAYPLSLLRLYTPLHRAGSDDIFAVAAVYYSARALLETEFRAQLAVWISVLVSGLIVTSVLYVFVDSTSRTISRQRGILSTNLAESRQLSEEVRRLHQASERLRVDAIDANEHLLASVGSDIHDGPLQLLTLIILQLSRQLRGRSDESELRSTMALTSDAMTELRNISAGLVLPELSALTLAATIELAVSRHQEATGTRVALHIDDLDQMVDTGIQVCVYRVVQEALTNAFRHAGGVEQSVSASRVDGMICVDIANAPTKLVDASATSPLRPKLGLRGMQLRIEAVGGGLSVEMGEERVVVRARVPGPDFH